MMMDLFGKLLAVGLVLPVVLAGPLVKEDGVANFIGEGTNELALALIQGFVNQEDNQVFSPLGYSSILAIFAEGARGESRQEIATALHFPEDVKDVRKAYFHVLKRLTTQKNNTNSPEFKNWFYIYKNYTVEEELKEVLREFYLTEVKVVNRPDDFDDLDKKVMAPTEKPDETYHLEKGVAAAVESASSVHKEDSEEAHSNNEPVLLSDKPKETEKEEVLSDMKAEKPAEVEEGEELPGSANNREKVLLTEQEESQLVKQSQGGTVPVIVVQEESMMMQRSEAVGPLDHFSGMTDSSLKIKGKGPQSQMIIFNGLYYRGDWKVPFQKRPADASRPFYKSDTEKVSVPTIHTEGQFLAGEIPALDARVVDLPYLGDRYSLLVVVPNSRSGLPKLAADLDTVRLSGLRKQLVEKALDVCLPAFEINTIAKPISSFSKLGLSQVTSIFDPVKADLSGISKDPGLYVEELVQIVSFKVDGDKAETNFLTASQAASRTDYEKFQINQPFLFFLRDNIDDVIIVTGKVTDPTPKPDFFDTDWKASQETVGN